MGEYEIITSLAKDFMNEGYSVCQSSEKAIIEYREALKDAMEYEYNQKKKEVKKVSQKINDFTLRIYANGYEGFDKEKKIVRDLADSMNEFGFVEGFELIDYIRDSINIEKYIHCWVKCNDWDRKSGRKGKEPRLEKIYAYLTSEIKRVNKNLLVKEHKNIC